MNQAAETIQQRIRFEEVSPANTGAAFLDVSIESLVVPLGLPIYEGYDGLDDLRFTFLTLPSGETVTLATYLNSPQPGTSIHVDSAIQNIPQVVFESCQQLQVSREEAIWFHPDWQDEIDRLYAEHGSIEKPPELSQVEEPNPSKLFEPIDCFYHALRIYTREYVPATYWAMLQHNLGLAYFNRRKGDRRENLERSIECFNQSLEIFTQNEFPEKWKINQDDLEKSQQFLSVFHKWSVIADSIKSSTRNGVYLHDDNLINANLIGAHLIGNNLSETDLSFADLNGAYLIGTNLINVNLSNANLSNAFLINTNLSGANLTNTNVKNTRFGDNIGISDSMKQDLIARGAIFDEASGDRSESRIPGSH